VVTELIRHGRTHTGTGSPAVTPGLFLGGLPGKPITASRLGSRLRALGIYAQTGRRAALLDLAAQLPAAVLADLLGLAPGTAVRWMRHAGGDWSGYAAELQIFNSQCPLVFHLVPGPARFRRGILR